MILCRGLIHDALTPHHRPNERVMNEAPTQIICSYPIITPSMFSCKLMLCSCRGCLPGYVLQHRDHLLDLFFRVVVCQANAHQTAVGF